MTTRHSHGFSLVELLVATVLSVMALGTTVVVGNTALRLSASVTSSSNLDEKCRRVHQILTTELRFADADAVLLGEWTGSSSVEFRLPVEYDEEVIWTAPIQYRVEPAATGDADHGMLLRSQDGRTEVLSLNVRPGGFQVVRDGTRLTIDLALGVTNDKEVYVQAQANSSVHLRN